MICGGAQATFSVLEASEVKFPALRGFVLPTHFPSGSGNLTRCYLTDLIHPKVEVGEPDWFTKYNQLYYKDIN